MDRSGFSREATKFGLRLSSQQLESFEAFEENLYRENERKNLTRVAREDCWTKHFLDSLLFQDLLLEESVVLDIGTGPGFPAWPLARARPDLQVTALDSNGKMLSFLRENLPPNLKVVEARAEEWHPCDRFDVVTGRALAPLAIQLEISTGLCRVGGAVIPMRSSGDEESILGLDPRKLGLELEGVNRKILPGLEAVRLFPVYRKKAETSQGFPRSWAEIKRRPFGSL